MQYFSTRLAPVVLILFLKSAYGKILNARFDLKNALCMKLMTPEDTLAFQLTSFQLTCHVSDSLSRWEPV